MTRSELQAAEDTIECMFSAIVNPHRSVPRARNALKEGRPVEPYLKVIEDGCAQVRALYDEHRARKAEKVCHHCDGTGREPVTENNQEDSP